ncbi:hypothetical protein [Rhizobium sp. YTU87027]|uniref:hypothetical protein n=1 Tax=Rhizobium sp. YTU87027 TaxID=3417741 RepID=UPI003D68E5D7
MDTLDANFDGVVAFFNFPEFLIERCAGRISRSEMIPLVIVCLHFRLLAAKQIRGSGDGKSMTSCASFA